MFASCFYYSGIKALLERLTLCLSFLVLRFPFMATGYEVTSTSERPFVSWQTWDLLKIMVYGFSGFCKNFLERHPGYTIYPIRLNGSAIETFFSQLKHVTSGHLSSVNYATARAAVLTRGSIKGRVRGEYRNAPLAIRQHPLQRTRYSRNKPDTS